MEKRLEQLFNNKAFESLEENKINALKGFMEKNQGKNANELLGEIIKLNSVLNQGEPLQENQKEAIFEAVLTVLSQEERNKLIKILSLFQNGF